MLVHFVLIVGILIVAAAMTNWFVGIAAAALAVAVGQTTNFESGMLAATIFTTLLYSNLPFGEGDGHDHGDHGPKHESTHWDPWGMVFRLTASVMISSGCVLFFLLGTDSAPFFVSKATTNAAEILTARGAFQGYAVLGLKSCAGILALLTAFQVVTNWTSAQPQG